MDSEQEIKLLEDNQRCLLKKRREIKETISELEARGRHIGYPSEIKNLGLPQKDSSTSYHEKRNFWTTTKDSQRETPTTLSPE
jgi:hypothetical protein